MVQAFGTTSVHPTSPGGAGNINNWDDSIIPPFRTRAEQVHAHGAIIACQLVHRGRRATSAVTRMPLLAPTDQPNERTGETPRAMSHGDIKMVIDAYAAAAERTCRAGFDGVEIAMFGDMVPGECLSPTVNTRTDEYGGTLEQRLRFPTELLLAVREAIDRDRLLIVRLSGDDFLPDELTLSERISVARHFEALDIVDLFSITGGTVKTLQGRPRHVPSSYFPHGVYLPLARALEPPHPAPITDAGPVAHTEGPQAPPGRGAAEPIG